MKQKKRIKLKTKSALYGYMFISFWVIGFLWLTLYPLFQSVYYSFNDVLFDSLKGVVTTGIGFENYIYIFTRELTFLVAIQDFIFQSLLYVILTTIISIIIALLLNQKIKFRGAFRAVFFLPVIIISGPIINTLFVGTVDPATGESVTLLSQMGIMDAIYSLLPEAFAEPMAILFYHLMQIFWFSGVQIILILAGLQKITRDIYEAAEIDGASSWEMFWKITLPSLKSTIAISAVYTIVTIAQISSNSVLNIIMQKMWQSDVGRQGFGYASALSWVYSIVVLVIIALSSLIIVRPKRVKKDEFKRYIRPYGR